MSGWREMIYGVPDSGGCALDRVLALLPDQFSLDLTALPVGGFCLKVADPSAAIFLRVSVPGLGVPDDQNPFLEPGDLFVPDSLRDRCEHELATRCHSGAIWEELIWAEFRNSDAQVAFERALEWAW